MVEAPQPVLRLDVTPKRLEIDDGHRGQARPPAGALEGLSFGFGLGDLAHDTVELAVGDESVTILVEHV